MKEERKVILHDFQVMARCLMYDLARRVALALAPSPPCGPILSFVGKKGSSSMKQVFKA